MSQSERLKILILDDDERFARRLTDYLHLQGIEAHWQRSLLELGAVGKLGSYSGLIVDPLIAPVNGLEVAQYVDAFVPGLPVLLVAKEELSHTIKRWPQSIVGFAFKDANIPDIAKKIVTHLRNQQSFIPYQQSGSQQRSCANA